MTRAARRKIRRGTPFRPTIASVALRGRGLFQVLNHANAEIAGSFLALRIRRVGYETMLIDLSYVLTA